MKKFDINPLFLVFAVLLIFGISIYSLNLAKANALISKNTINKNIKIVKQYDILKNTWTNTKKQENIINKLLKKQNIKNANILIKNNKIIVTINTNTKVLHRFVNKLLNKKLNIIKLKMSNDTLKFEVGLL